MNDEQEILKQLYKELQDIVSKLDELGYSESPEPITIKFRCDKCGNMMELFLNPEHDDKEKNE